MFRNGFKIAYSKYSVEGSCLPKEKVLFIAESKQPEMIAKTTLKQLTALNLS